MSGVTVKPVTTTTVETVASVIVRCSPLIIGGVTACVVVPIVAKNGAPARLRHYGGYRANLSEVVALNAVAPEKGEKPQDWANRAAIKAGIVIAAGYVAC